MSARTRDTVRLLALVLGCLGTGAAVGLAQESGAPDPAGPWPAVAPVDRVDAEQAQGFSVLRREQAASDAPTGRVAEAIRLGPEPELGANPGLARRVGSGIGLELFVVPARSELCIADASGAVSCNSTAAARDGLVATSTRSAAGLARVVGLAPDGVARVTVHLAGGATATARVVENTYAGEYVLQVVGVSFTRGERVVEVPIVSP